MKYLIITLCFWTTSLFHGGHIAEFYYSLDGKYLKLKFEIEKEDLMHFDFPDDCDMKNMTALCTTNYLNQYAIIEINGKKITMELQNSITKGDHLIVYLKSELNTERINEINIQNHCFYEFDKKYKNRIVLDIAHFQKSYLLKKNKETIHLK